MKESQIAQIRLANQQITAAKFTNPRDIVGWLGAVQAQDYGMAKWAVGLRLQSATETSVEAAIDDGTIMRTHVLRPTWHFAAAEDIRWMLDLTAPRVHKACAFGMRWFELDGPTLKICCKTIARALKGGNHLTRQELMAKVENDGIMTNTQRASHIMLHAELEQIVCSGKRRGKQFTYALFDERVPPTGSLTREAALAKLAERYFTSHGPAKLKDFAWWSGLTVAEAALAVKLIESSLCTEKFDGEIYWMSNALTETPMRTKSIRLLPAFDEFTVSYKDRSAAISPERLKDVTTGHAIFKPIIIVDGRVVGVWKRKLENAVVRIEYTLFDETKTPSHTALEKAAKSYAAFVGKKLQLNRI